MMTTCAGLCRRTITKLKTQRICILQKYRNHPRYLSVTRGKNASFSEKIKNGPELCDFVQTDKLSASANIVEKGEGIPYLSEDDYSGNNRKVYFDVHGCQMNINDTEIAWSILKNCGFQRTKDIKESDVILVMTCSIRENAEEKIWNRLQYYKYLKAVRQSKPRKAEKVPLKIGVLGCMAERLKNAIVEKEKAVDLVCGPDAYRDLPRMLAQTRSGQTAVNVILSLEETYCNVIPVRLNENSTSAFVSIMRGCDNMCSYCIVPFTRGRERSRPVESILEEISILSDQGVKEVTLLGQNVNSYQDLSKFQTQGINMDQLRTKTSKGFSTVYKPKVGGRRFAELLDKVSAVNPEIRIRFTSPHPKDFPDEVLYLIKERANICNSIHLPAQSGNNQVLERMHRGYTREAYIDLVNHIRHILPDVSLTSDFIAGFCGETEEAHKDSLSLIENMSYSFAFCFPYSMREKTRAFHRLKDDVPQDVKDRRHMELVKTFRMKSHELNTKQIGQVQLVLIEGKSKRCMDQLAGRNEANIKVIIPQQKLPSVGDLDVLRPMDIGDYVAVKITDATSQTLIATPLHHTTLQHFSTAEAKHHQHTADCTS